MLVRDVLACSSKQTTRVISLNPSGDDHHDGRQPATFQLSQSLQKSCTQLDIHPRCGTTVVGLFIADEKGDTVRRPNRRWFYDLYPDPRDIAARIADPAGQEGQR